MEVGVGHAFGGGNSVAGVAAADEVEGVAIGGGAGEVRCGCGYTVACCCGWAASRCCGGCGECRAADDSDADVGVEPDCERIRGRKSRGKNMDHLRY